jgi:fused signal recognition particle receptor
MFSFFKNTLNTIYSQFTSKISSLFSQDKIDEVTLQKLEQLLIEADTGIKTTRELIEKLKKKYTQRLLQKGEDLKKNLEQELYNMLKPFDLHKDRQVYLLVGINGSGKTTFAGKLAHNYATQGKKVLLVAGDTYRAAATEQLGQWAQKTNSDIIVGKQEQDPGSVIFSGCQRYKEQQYDIMIIDTAGRLQTKINLMHELAKLKRVIEKQLPEHTITTLLTIDSMLGQNSLQQAKLFHESTYIDSIVLTKMDGTGKGGIVFAINHEIGIPVSYITFGEDKKALKVFDQKAYVQELLSE